MKEKPTMTPKNLQEKFKVLTMPYQAVQENTDSCTFLPHLLSYIMFH